MAFIRMQVSCYLHNATEESSTHVTGLGVQGNWHEAGFSHEDSSINHAKGHIWIWMCDSTTVINSEDIKKTDWGNSFKV